MRISRGLLPLTVLCLSLCACGWQLRGLERGVRPQALNLVVENRFEPIVLAVRDIMRQNGIAISDTTPLQLHLGREELARRTVAVTPIGSASQYELTLSVAYRYHLQGEPTHLARKVRVHRVFDFDPTNTVAKNEEENTLLEEMRREIAVRLLNQVPVEYGQDQR